MTGLSRGTRAALAAISGLALAAAFPKVDLGLLAWVAFVPLLYAIRDESTGRLFLYAWLQGFVCNIASVYWIAITLHSFTSLRIDLAITPMLLLAAIIALYGAIAFAFADFTAVRFRIPIVVTLPIAWTALEWVRTYFPIGFPWNLLGYTAYRNLQLIQFAELTGVYGISALIIFANVVVYVVAFQVYSRRTQAVSLGALTFLMAAAFVFGSIRVRGLQNAQGEASLNVAMVQGDIPQSLKWDPKFLKSSFDVYADQSRSAARRGADLIVWPEAAAAFFFQPDERYPAAFAEDARYRQQLLALAVETADPILFGAPALGVEDGRVGFYNRAYLVSGRGEVIAWYDKIQLVPFGEYVPLRSLFGYFVNRVVAGFGDMFAGSKQTVFTVKDAKLGVLICYESIFPDLARSVVNDGADILINITNDAWYGESSAPYQLLAMAAMRAVETKVPLVRVANTGISAVIQPTGAITAPTPLFVRGTETELVYWRRERTVYTRVGDLFAEACLILTLAGFLDALTLRRGASGRRGVGSDQFPPNGRAHERTNSHLLH
ncbi:MAG TPA: apolipoprotein N-acyltransferase [Candidatus Binataceae bacterium]|nr:apolipoprotein N-acyltransferase [Candidatus Binataceae bacterium]